MQVIQFQKFGDPAIVLSLKELPQWKPAAGEVSVRMIASPINPSDLMFIRGTYGIKPELPAVPGFEGVGVVEENGGGLLGRMLVGKRVAVINKAKGNWCEKTVIPAKQAIPVPKFLSDDQAASFFVNPATAYLLTRNVLKVPRGEWLLQTAAGSALGRMVIKLGQREKFRTINVVRRDEQVEELKSLGADEVLCCPSTDESDLKNLQEEISRLTGNKGIRFAIDPVGGPLASAVIPCLAAGGRLIVFGTLSNLPLSFSSRELMTKGTTVEGFWLGKSMQQLTLPKKLMLIRKITGMFKDGLIESQVHSSFPLAKYRQAVTTAITSQGGEKVLLKMNRLS